MESRDEAERTGYEPERIQAAILTTGAGRGGGFTSWAGIFTQLKRKGIRMTKRRSGLCLTRRPGDAVDIDGGRIVVVVDSVIGGSVRLKFIADESVTVVRQELLSQPSEVSGEPAA